jgi:hypothetical protein
MNPGPNNRHPVHNRETPGRAGRARARSSRVDNRDDHRVAVGSAVGVAILPQTAMLAPPYRRDREGHRGDCQLHRRVAPFARARITW